MSHSDKNSPRTDHADWDTTFIRAAYVFADRSKDPSSQVGAVIASAENATFNNQPVGNRLLSQGYNGAPNGWSDEVFPWNRDGDDASETKYPYIIHAEMNAILNFFGDTSHLRGATVYTTHFPCYECTRHMAQLGIVRIVYDTPHSMPTASANIITAKIAKECGVSIEQTPERIGPPLNLM